MRREGTEKSFLSVRPFLFFTFLLFCFLFSLHFYSFSLPIFRLGNKSEDETRKQGVKNSVVDPKLRAGRRRNLALCLRKFSGPHFSTFFYYFRGCSLKGPGIFHIAIAISAFMKVDQ